MAAKKAGKAGVSKSGPGKKAKAAPAVAAKKAPKGSVKGSGAKTPKSGAKSAASPGRGPNPGERFGTQAKTLARVMRDHGISYSVGGITYDAAEIAKLAVLQAEDEDQDAVLLKQYNDFHPDFTGRSRERGAKFSSALDAVRGALKGNRAALEDLKGARFSVGNSAAKGAKGATATTSTPAPSASATTTSKG